MSETKNSDAASGRSPPAPSLDISRRKLLGTVGAASGVAGWRWAPRAAPAAYAAVEAPDSATSR